MVKMARLSIEDLVEVDTEMSHWCYLITHPDTRVGHEFDYDMALLKTRKRLKMMGQDQCMYLNDRCYDCPSQEECELYKRSQ